MKKQKNTGGTPVPRTEFVTTAEAGEIRGVSAARIRQWIGEGRLKSELRGRDRWVRVCDLMAVAGMRRGRKKGKGA